MFDGKKFSKALKKNNITSEELALELKGFGVKLKKDAIDSYRKGVVKTPNLPALIYTAQMFNITIIDFLEDRDKLRKKITIDELKNNPDAYWEHLPDTAPLPSTLKKVLFNHGYPSANKIVMENNMHNAEYIYIDKLTLPKEYQTKELKAVIIIGDAMQPCLRHGDIAIYHPVSHYQAKGKYVINSVDGLEVVNIEKLKKCQSLVLKPSNPIFTTETFLPNEQDIIEFVGIVVSSVSKN